MKTKTNRPLRFAVAYAQGVADRREATDDRWRDHVAGCPELERHYHLGWSDELLGRAQ